jgi:hypothetical protein
MKIAFRLTLFSVMTAWAINASAIVSSDVTLLAAQTIPIKNFKSVWIDTGKSLGYPKFSNGKSEPDGMPTINMVWANPVWLSAPFGEWQSYDNKIKFYLSGLIVALKYKVIGLDHDESLSQEDFKSITLGYYQCVNTVSDMQQFLLNQKIVRFTDTVEENFTKCGKGRIGSFELNK